VAAVFTALALPALASANTQTVPDGNDRPGLLDIRSVNVTHVGGWLRYRITTWNRWRTSVIGQRTPNFIALGLDMSGNRNYERLVAVFVFNGRLRAFLLNANTGRVLNISGATRPNAKSVSFRIARAPFVAAGGYGWSAFSVYRLGSRNIVDAAPNRSNRFHDVAAPRITLGAFPGVTTSASATTDFPVSFTINDRARSAGVDWRVERRLVGSATRETAVSGVGVGAKAPTVTGVEGANYLMRVVATDRHGNSAASAEVPVSVPFDDANAAFAAAYAGTWTNTPAGTPFMGTLRQTVLPGSTFTYTFMGSEVSWIAPGAPTGLPGTATVAIDGGPGATVDPSTSGGERAIVFSASGLDPSVPHTIVITHVSGAITIDALLVR
jgi:hypothetical protein